VDIHTKPGYDPAELLIDPKIKFPKLKAGLRLLQKKLGFRYNMDLIPVEGSGVNGSHGRIPSSIRSGPIIASHQSEFLTGSEFEPTDVHDIIYNHVAK
jgi:hypothetical protein